MYLNKVLVNRPRSAQEPSLPSFKSLTLQEGEPSISRPSGYPVQPRTWAPGALRRARRVYDKRCNSHRIGTGVSELVAPAGACTVGFCAQ